MSDDNAQRPRVDMRGPVFSGKSWALVCDFLREHPGACAFVPQSAELPEGIRPDPRFAAAVRARIDNAKG